MENKRHQERYDYVEKVLLDANYEIFRDGLDGRLMAWVSNEYFKSIVIALGHKAVTMYGEDENTLTLLCGLKVRKSSINKGPELSFAKDHE